MLEWFDNYDGPKILNRSARRWKCILAGKCPTATAYGDTPEEAVRNAIELGKQRKRTFAELAAIDAANAALHAEVNR